MKYLFFLLCGLLAAPALRAVTITGMVTDAKNYQPVAGLLVNIYDSAGSFNISTVTNSGGLYTAALPFTPALGAKVIASTIGCGVVVTTNVHYSGVNMSGANLSVCSGVSLYTLQGSVQLHRPNNGQARLYLIQKIFNTSVMDTTFSIIDSFATTLSGGGFSRAYTAIPAGILFLKAELLPSHPEYRKYLPGYYSSAITYSNAARLTSTNFIASDTIIISMTSTADTSGVGSIGGEVIAGAGKATAPGDPVPNRILVLTNSSNVPVRYTYSNSGGYFRFDSLAYGTYKIFGDVLGKNNPAITITITAAKPEYVDILFTETSKTFSAQIRGLGVAANGTATDIIPFPNPVSDELGFTRTEGIKGSKTLTICDMQGVVLLKQTFSDGQDVAVKTGFLPAGMFIVTLQTDAGTARFHVLK